MKFTFEYEYFNKNKKNENNTYSNFNFVYEYDKKYDSVWIYLAYGVWCDFGKIKYCWACAIPLANVMCFFVHYLKLMLKYKTTSTYKKTWNYKIVLSIRLC